MEENGGKITLRFADGKIVRITKNSLNDKNKMF